MGMSTSVVVDSLNHMWNEPLSGKREIDQKHNHTCIEGVEFGNNHEEQIRWQVEGMCRNVNVQRGVYMGSAQYVTDNGWRFEARRMASDGTRGWRIVRHMAFVPQNVHGHDSRSQRKVNSQYIYISRTK